MSRQRLYAIRLGLASALALLLGACTPVPDQAVTVGAAASMRVVMPDLVAEFGRRSGLEVTVNYGASGTIARQVERGAPIDLVVVVSARVLDELELGGLLVAGSRRPLATNTMVLVGRAGTRPVLFTGLGKPGPSFRLAVGDPRTVPAGVYARQALEELGHWQQLEGHLVLGRDVTAVLAYSRRGEVDAGIVYATDSSASPELSVFDRARAPWAPKPEVLAALTANSEDRKARAGRLLDFLVSDKGQRILAAAGFGPPGERP